MVLVLTVTNGDDAIYIYMYVCFSMTKCKVCNLEPGLRLIYHHTVHALERAEYECCPRITDVRTYTTYMKENVCSYLYKFWSICISMCKYMYLMG